MARVAALRRVYRAAASASDWPRAQAIEAEMVAVASTLDARGHVAAPAALQDALGVSRGTWSYVVAHYADGRHASARVHPDGPTARLLRALRAAGDVRFPAASARLTEAAGKRPARDLP